MSNSDHKSVTENQIQLSRLVWVDLIKIIALIWIFLNHIIEFLFGAPYIANPSAGWPPLAARLAQLRPLEEYGIGLNFLRYLGWFGDQGVQLFLIVSGFGLTWGLLARYGKASFPVGEFYRRRAMRIYPLWWGAHLLFVVGTYLAQWVDWGLWLGDSKFYLSMLGIRITPDLLYYFAPAWWYIGLVIQLYLIYPILWTGLRRLGPFKLLVVSCLVAFTARAFGLVLFDTYIDAWQRGAIFITRLPEFAFGICLAAWLNRNPEQIDARLRAPSTLLIALVSYVLGTLLSLTVLGMVVAPFMLGVGVFLLLYAALGGSKHTTIPGTRIWTWLSRYVYPLYLLHHPMIFLLVPAGLAGSSRRILVGIIAAVLLTIIGAVVLDGIVNRVLAILEHWHRKVGLAGTALRVGAFGLVAGGLIIGSELFVQYVAPQEVIGWGERASLEPHSIFGWRLKPSQQTQLRWESYDYQVTANELGFPGAAYPAHKTPGAVRILTTGDAFTSAEGVDTNQAWPRLLENNLAAQLPDNQIEVLNFAITGYGPNQYTAVIETFAPVYQPDLIVIGFFVNDYRDVLISNEEFQQSIGFGRPAPNSFHVTSHLMHLRHFVDIRLIEPLTKSLRGEPDPYGYFLGYFVTLERDRPEFKVTGRELTADRLKKIKTVADQQGAQVVIAMIPAPVQVCKPSELAYYPSSVDLADSTRYDLDLPQRLTQELAESLEIGYYDLRPTLQSMEQCPYQPRNSHWTAAGHRTMATYLTEILVADGYFKKP